MALYLDRHKENCFSRKFDKNPSHDLNLRDFDAAPPDGAWAKDVADVIQRSINNANKDKFFQPHCGLVVEFCSMFQTVFQASH